MLGHQFLVEQTSNHGNLSTALTNELSMKIYSIEKILEVETHKYERSNFVDKNANCEIFNSQITEKLADSLDDMVRGEKRLKILVGCHNNINQIELAIDRLLSGPRFPCAHKIHHQLWTCQGQLGV